LTADQASSQTTKEGAYINGLYLEGAGWDVNKNQLIDSEPMKLYQEMPIIHLKPLVNEGKVKQKKGQALYQCPTYMYPIRTGQREKPSFMFMVNLPCKPVAT
jgi:dynein heavy chain